MGLYLPVVVILVALLANIDTLSNGVLAKSLRANKSDEGRSEIEARGGGVVSKVLNYFKDNNFKSDDFVKGKLKLKGLSGDELTGHKNYKYFQKFVESNQLDVWMKADTSTIAVWKELGLGNVNTWDDLMKAVDTDAFNLYQRYADSFENNAFIEGRENSKNGELEKSYKPELLVMTTLGIDKLHRQH
ncbi:RxLR effector protein [Phytophthora megakarya]|uniref:RxLR effector protein n=1 Tax=Phytophthora megakarya TaxID=4795 RepID=A0A225VFF0_9STRA|nr:RxLR effector protein [Phytophthora megakarya]